MATTFKPWHFAGAGILVDEDDNETVLSAVYDDTAQGRLIVAAPDLLAALRTILPLAESYLKGAPGHSDNAKLEDARAALVKAVRG